MRAQRGAAVATHIESVVAANAADLLRYFQRRTDSTDDAPDLVGRLLLVLWERADRVPEDALEARLWCYGVARNILREHRRAAVSRSALADDLREYLLTLPVPPAPDDLVESAMRSEDVRHALKVLKEPARELIILVHWDRCTIAEAGRILGLNASTARTRYGRALRMLERQLRDPQSRVAPVDSAAPVPIEGAIRGERR